LRTGDEATSTATRFASAQWLSVVSAFCRTPIAEAGFRSIPVGRGWELFTLVSRRSTSLGDTRPNILIASLVTLRFEDLRHRAFANANAANDASTLVHMLERHLASRRTRRGGRCRSCGDFLDACLLDFWDRSSNVVDERVNLPKAPILSMATSTRSTLASVSRAITLSAIPGLP
jgi:hypothetical protein